MKKILIGSLLSLLSFSCSVVVSNNSTQETSSPSLDFSDLEKEYKSFSTKALSDTYVSRMFTRFLSTSPNPTQVIRQLEFARYLKDVKSDTSYYNSLKTFIGGDIAKFNLINNTTGVAAKKTTESATFGVFVDSLNPNFNNIVNSGMVLNLDAGSIASYPGNGTTWTDLTGNGSNGTLINGPAFSSDNQGSLVFDGVDDYVKVITSINTSGNSVGLWFKQSTSANRGIIETTSINSVGSGTPYLYVNASSGTLKTYAVSGTPQYSDISSYSANTWYYLAITRTSSTENTYLNGILKLSNKSLSIGGTNTQFNIGVGYHGCFNGNISNVQVYNRPLSSTEVLQNYNATKSRFGL